ncbi:MAG: dUTP diphosphatase [Nannocystaceae bacterium]
MRELVPEPVPALLVRRLCADARLPRRMTDHAAGLDLAACLPDGARTLQAGERAAIPTGIAVAIASGYEGQIRPRSGLALRHGIAIANAPGTIDPDYRGELKVLLINLGSDAVEIHHHDRVAQLVVAPVAAVSVREVDVLPPTTRGDAGFGSTGR